MTHKHQYAHADIQSITIDWASGALEIGIMLADHVGETLSASEISSFSLTKLEPWGPNDEIFTLDTVVGDDGTTPNAIIQMQNGDAITVAAARIQFGGKDTIENE